MTDPTAQTEHRFNHLVASGGTRRVAWSSRTAIVSLLFHSVLIVGAAYATVREPHPATIDPLLPELVIVPEKKPEVQPASPVPVVSAPGTQTLTPPEQPPLAIPDIDVGEAPVSADQFSGEGTISADIEEVPSEELGPPAQVFAYTVAELDETPKLRNQLQMIGVFERLYPRMLQDAGIGGTVWLEFLIEPDGIVDMESVKVLDSPHDQLARATVEAIERFRFRPGRYQGEPVRVLIQMPITWAAK